jgi:hypothetical protein
MKYRPIGKHKNGRVRLRHQILSKVATSLNVL